MTEPNAQQIEYWNQLSGPKWVDFADTINAQLEPIGFAAMDHAGVREGERVLDVGCGCGQTSIELGRRVGARGEVLGVDVSGPMLEDARARAGRAGMGHVHFTQADAQTHAFEHGRFDLLFSRFGVMFFEDPTAAFSNLRTALSDTGRLRFVCWQAVALNPWMAAPAMSAAKFVELPARPPEGAPGPFAFADASGVSAMLEAAGFRDVGHHALEGDTVIGQGRPLGEIVEFMMQMGPAGAALREAGDAVRAQALTAAEEDMAAAYRDGAVRLPYAAWLFEARS
jgi:SAM-dependent methyltransferase